MTKGNGDTYFGYVRGRPHSRSPLNGTPYLFLIENNSIAYSNNCLLAAGHKRLHLRNGLIDGWHSIAFADTVIPLAAGHKRLRLRNGLIDG